MDIAAVKKKRTMIPALIVFAFSIGLFYFSDGGIGVGPVTVMTKYLYAFAIFLMGAAAFLYAPQLEKGAWMMKDGIVLVLPYVLTVLISMLLWIVQNSPFHYMSRGFSYSAYQIVALLTSMAYLFMFGKKAIYLQLLAMAAANGILIYKNGISVSGFGPFLQDYFNLVTSFGSEATDLTKQVELNDLTYAIGLVLLYFLLQREKVKYRFPCILLSGFLFSTGLKRIGVAAVAGAVILTVLCGVFSENVGKKMMRIIAFAMIVFGIGYIAFITFGFYNEIAEILQIDTKGRNEINDFIDGYYLFSPLFLGYGLGYVSRLLGSGAAERYGAFLALHNDYLRMYVEVGFWGYLVWLWTSWGTRISWFCRKREFGTAIIAFAVTAYCFITYLTDNTCYYFYTNLVAFTLILSCEKGDVYGKRQ